MLPHICFLVVKLSSLLLPVWSLLQLLPSEINVFVDLAFPTNRIFLILETFGFIVTVPVKFSAPQLQFVSVGHCAVLPRQQFVMVPP